MWLIVGLGNPGKQYSETRHNLGFMVIDAFVQALQLEWRYSEKCLGFIACTELCGKSCILLKPNTFVNLSGQSVCNTRNYYKLAVNNGATLVIYDDVHLNLGTVKIKQNVKSGGHNGVRSILDIPLPDMIHFKIGIGPEPLDIGLEQHVLSSFTEAEKFTIHYEMPNYLKILNKIIEKGLD